MRKYTFLMAILCLLCLTACQKESIAPLPEIIDESSFLQLNTSEDLVNFEKMVDNEEVAISRSNWHGKVIHVPRNSKNALQKAIHDAGRYGLVLLEKGDHYEDETVLIEQPVYILGRKGAILHSAVRLAHEAGVIEPAFHVNNTTRVTIWGVNLQANSNGGGTAILVEQSTKTTLSKCQMDNFQAGIMLEHGDQTTIWKNQIKLTPRVLTENLAPAFGVTIINGDDARVVDNKITGGVFGIWACDNNGVAQHNETYGNLIGLILCNVPVEIPLASGLTGSEEPANRWMATDNYSHDNFDVGYLVIDGANNNTLLNNRGGNNARVDMELTQDTYRFGFLTPKSFDNFVDARSYQDLTIKDCGDNNRIRGGVMIDTTERPCF